MSPTFTRDIDAPTYKGTISVNTGLFINGKFVDAVGGTTVEYVTMLVCLWRILKFTIAAILTHVRQQILI